MYKIRPLDSANIVWLFKPNVYIWPIQQFPRPTKVFYYMYKSQASKARSLSFCRYFFFGIGGGVVLYSHNEC
jgi:hypothetical protein